LLRLYRQLFGRQRIHVYLYEAFKADRRGFVRALCRQLELDYPDVPTVDGPRNASLPAAALPVVRRINFFTAGRVLDKNHIVHIPGAFWLGRGVGRVASRLSATHRGSDLSALIPERRMRQIEAYYSESNRYLAAEFGLPLAEYGYPLGAVEPAVAKTGSAPGAACRTAP
jgi:hypothetical protein